MVSVFSAASQFKFHSRFGVVFLFYVKTPRHVLFIRPERKYFRWMLCENMLHLANEFHLDGYYSRGEYRIVTCFVEAVALPLQQLF